MSERAERNAALREALEQRVLVLDGATGTALQAAGLTADDFGGPALEGCNESLVRTRPDVVAAVHRSYLSVGADIVETNSFGATSLVLAEYGLADEARSINQAAARIARMEADRFSKGKRLRFVAGSMGPTTKSLSVTGGTTFDGLTEAFAEQARGLIDGGADYLLVETCQDTLNIKAALLGIARAQEHLPREERLPVAVSATVETTGTLLAGQAVEALVASLEHVELLYLGLNCATGPAFMADHLRALGQLCRTRVACVPNAGLPNEDGRYQEGPDDLARCLRRFGQEGLLNLIGGCCGTTAAHIDALVELAPSLRPRVPPRTRGSCLSGIERLDVDAQTRPILVGERTNVMGSKKFRDLIAAERWEDAAEVARAQVKGGAHVVDVSTQQTDRDERSDLGQLLPLVVKKVRVPVMIDSTDERTVEAALKHAQGKWIINSVNLEDGEARLGRFAALAAKYGAALVVGCIDETGQAITAARKLAVAQRAVRLLTERHGLAAEDLYLDPLVFPCASGDAAYTGSAMETIEALRLLRRELPACRTVLGISNVSFGLPGAGREVVNSVFLQHCVQAGLDLAIVNTERLVRFPSLLPAERELAEAVLFCRGEGDTPHARLSGAIARFAAHFRERKPAAAQAPSGTPAERLTRCILEGSRDGLVRDLDLELARGESALAIINGPLMRGMDEVGRLFNANQLIVAEVLQSAEAMKAAVRHLEPHMDKAAGPLRGKVLLATVKGDVHDIGKNLVEIVLANNGFQVIDLGIRVPPEKLIEAARQHHPDAIGLSGLLVKSAQQMAATAQDLRAAGIQVPLLVGGAALSRGYTDRQIAPAYGGIVAYAQDAMTGLALAKELCDPKTQQATGAAISAKREESLKAKDAAPSPPRSGPRARDTVEALAELPRPADFDRHLFEPRLSEVFSLINPTMLYGHHLGLRGPIVRRLEEASDEELLATKDGHKAHKLRQVVREVKAAAERGLLRPRGVFQFLRARADGDAIVLTASPGKAPVRFDFPRQPFEGGLCLSDYLRPGAEDSLCAFVVTAGAGVREEAQRLKEAGEYLRSHILQALALETAEALAELLHARIRALWGFADHEKLPAQEIFKGRYRGRRYSFGYPACPRLEDQALLFALLSPEEIGVTLTDGFMMEPEASVSAIAFHHPQAAYFSAVESQQAGAAAALPLRAQLQVRASSAEAVP